MSPSFHYLCVVVGVATLHNTTNLADLTLTVINYSQA